MKIRVEMEVESQRWFDGVVTLDGYVGDYGIVLHLTAKEFRRAVELQVADEAGLLRAGKRRGRVQ